MYLVVSEWEAKPGKEAEFEQAGEAVAARLQEQPGVVLFERFKSGDRYISIHGYEDEATYRKLIDDPGGVFTQAATEQRLEEFGSWVRSERGKAIRS